MALTSKKTDYVYGLVLLGMLRQNSILVFLGIM